MEEEKKQEQEWKEAQKVNISVDLIAAAKIHLQFLAHVDRNRWLYDAPALHKAIYRYNVCWLPLLERHSDSPFFEGPLVVPLDCEWVWHCHRLNPVRYKSDCEELYGKILDNRNVVSSSQGTSIMDTKEAWKTLCPDEPYELDFTTGLDDNYSEEIIGLEKYIRYDLLLAIQRQAPFFYQVSRPHVNTDLYLEGALARYKGFLHLIKRIKERSIKSFSVPTYDIDLIWHTHQLHPVSYCNDLLNIMGKILEHDDTDSDRTKGNKLDVGFSGTTKNFEEMYGCRYWRAGAMYRGSAPSPLRTTPYLFSSELKDIISDEDKHIVHIRESKVIEVMLQFVSIKYLQEEHKGSVYVSFRKTQPDAIFNAKRKLTILSESGEKQVACFQCEPTGSILVELISHPPSSNPVLKPPSRTLGSCSISFEDILLPESGLIIEKWLDLTTSTSSKSSKPISLRVAVSVTLPTPAPFVLNMLRNRLLSKGSCVFPLPGRHQNARNCTRVVDEDGNEIITLQMRESKKTNKENESVSRKEVVGIFKNGERCNLAERVGTDWSFIRSSHWSIQAIKTTDNDSHILIGHHIVKFYAGRKLEYEHKHCKLHDEELKHEKELITAVEYSAKEPYGRAVALLNLSSGTVTVKEKWILLPSIVVAYMLGEIMRKEGYDSIVDFLNSFKDGGTPTRVVNPRLV